MIVDAGAIYSFFVRDAPQHWVVAGAIELGSETEEMVVSPFAVAEVLASIASGLGADAQLVALEEFARGSWVIASISVEHIREMHAELERQPGMSASEASSLVLASERRDDLLSSDSARYPRASVGGHPLRMATGG